MSNKPFNINSNYAQLTKYIILADHKYLTMNHKDLETILGISLDTFTPIIDKTIHDNIAYQDITGYFNIRKATLRYKVIPARYQVAESALLFKTMQQVVANSDISNHDFVLFTLPGISLGESFVQKVTRVLEYLNHPAQDHIDCVLLDYAYLGTKNNLVELVTDHQQIDQDPAYTQILQTCKPFDNLEFITSSICKLKVPLNKGLSTTLTVGIPMSMGITYTHCFLLRKSRMAYILKQIQPHWVISDIKRYVPVSQTLIVTPSLVNTSYPIYDLSISRQDILELNRQYIQHSTTIDNYRKRLYQFIPWLVYLGRQHNPIISKFSKLLHKVLACDYKL